MRNKSTPSEQSVGKVKLNNIFKDELNDQLWKN